MWRYWDDDMTRYILKRHVKAYDIQGRRIYPCVRCKNMFTGKKITVDHIIPTGFGYTEGKVIDNMQMLCHQCHMKKSTIEDWVRKKFDYCNKEVEKKLYI